MEQVFEPDKRVMQYLKLVGLDREIKRCDGLHLKQLQAKDNPKVLAKLRQLQEQQYNETLKRLIKLRDNFREALKETVEGLEKAGEIEVSKDISAKDAFGYLNKAIEKVESYIKDMGGASGGQNL
jgi:hypothetical protein